MRSPPRCRSGSAVRLGPEHVAKIGGRLAAQGLLAGYEDKAPPRSNPLLSLRWKVLFTDPKVTRAHHAPVRAAVPPVGAAAGPARLPRRLLVRPHPQGRRGGHRRRVQPARAAAARARPDGRLGGVPRDRPRGGLPLRRRQARRHGRRHLPRLARLLHGRHRRLPAAAALPPAHRPRRHLLQRVRRRAHARHLARDRHRGAAAADRRPDARDRQEPLAGDPRGRLPHPLRRDRRPGPLRAHGPDAQAPAAVEAPRAVGAEGLGARVRDGLGADHRPDPAGDGLQRDPAVPQARRLGVGERLRPDLGGWATRTRSAWRPGSSGWSRSRSRSWASR